MNVVSLTWQGITRGLYDLDSRTYKRRAKPGHFCIKHRGWGIQAAIVDELARRGCTTVVIEYERADGSVSVLATDFEHYRSDGIHDTLTPYDGEQVFVREEFFTRLGYGQTFTPRPDPAPTLERWGMRP